MPTRFHRHLAPRSLAAMVSVLALSAGAALTAGAVHAQDAANQDAAPAPAPAASDEATVVIVVGTPGGKGINKLKASYAVTNINANDLLQASAAEPDAPINSACSDEQHAAMARGLVGNVKFIA